jgi:hypothetical protein
VILLSLASFALADCRVSSVDLARTVEQAELAFGSLDVDSFRTNTTRLDAEVKCLRDLASPALAARIHRLEGLRAWIDQDAERSRASFAAARAIEPEYQFPQAMVPVGHPVLNQYELSEPGARFSALAVPANARLFLDGTEAVQRADDRAALAQLLHDKGSIRASALLWPGEPMFPYDTKQEAAKGPNLPLSIVAAASLALGITTYALAADTHAQFENPNTDVAALPALQESTNTLFFTSVGAGAIALGTGIGAVVAGTW